MISYPSRRLLLIGVLLLVCILVQAPAQVVYSSIVAKVPELQASALTGSAWRGVALGVVAPVAGQAIGVDRLGWKLRPLSILQLRPTIDFEGSQESRELSGRFEIGVGSTWSLKEAKIEFPLARFGSGSTSVLNGTLVLEIDALTVMNNILVDVRGRAWLFDATLQLTGGALSLPDIAAQLEPSTSGGLRAVITSSNNDVFGLTGELAVNRSGSYQLETVVTLAGSASGHLGSTLSLLGDRLGNNQYRLVFTGDSL